MQPVSLQTLAVPKRLLPHPDVFGSMDRGCSLSKLLYKKSIPNDDENVSLQMATFANNDFEEAMRWLSARVKEEGVTEAKFRVSGLGGEKYKDLVAEATGLQVDFIDEFVSHSAGSKFLVENFEDDAFCYPPPPAAEIPPLPDWMATIQEKAKDYFKDSIGKRLPSIFCFCGSGIGFNMLYEDDTMDMMGATMLGGKSLLGISQLLLGTTDYNELTSLAAAGSCSNVDTVVGEVAAQGEKSDFGGLPPDLPLFHMGKPADRGASIADFAKEDIAASIVNLVVSNMVAQIGIYCKMKRVCQVYIGGNMFKAPALRDAFRHALLLNIGINSVATVSFLSVGHTACIGSIIISPEEAQRRRREIKTD